MNDSNLKNNKLKKIDQIDNELLKILSINSKTSNIKIAKQLSLTEGAVRFRIKKLEKLNVIKKYTIETNDLTTDHKSIYALVMVKSKGNSKKLMKSITDLGLAHEVFEIAGEFDGCVILKDETIEEIDKKIDLIRNIPFTLDTKTFISFKKW